MSPSGLRIGTRGSALALRQAGLMRDALVGRGHAAELVILKTSGDRFQGGSLAPLGGKGLFVKEIEEALLKGEIDLAVHSLKDLPADLPAGLTLAAVPPRADPRDALVHRDRRPLAALPAGTRLGTSSLRRKAQLRALRPDLEVLDLRGNLDTRLRKVREGQVDAVVVAAAGLERMGWSAEATERFAPEALVPAPGQGLLALECRVDDPRGVGLLRALHDPQAGTAARAERSFLRALGGGCQVPAGGYAFLESDRVRMLGLVASLDGRSLVRERVEGSVEEAEELGRRLAETLLAHGGRELLAAVTAAVQR